MHCIITNGVTAFILFSLLLAVNGVPTNSSQVEGRSTLQTRGGDWDFIKSGYVAFGDSYAAGMGTGTTTGDSCRIGSNNFPTLLFHYMNKPDINFQARMCSGDTLVGVNRQIDEWERPTEADLATLSVGGNDLNFSDLVYSCLLTPLLSSSDPDNCAASKKQANDYLNDQSDQGLKAKLKDAYMRIINKSSRTDFHLYVTGYPSFFNYDTSDCSFTTFYWWNPHWGPPIDRRYILLYQQTRHELDDMVDKLSGTIAAAADWANQILADNGIDPQVHFVNVNSHWGGHRWCESNTFHEPNEGREDTWFFLSGWRDYSILEPNDVVYRSTDNSTIEAMSNVGLENIRELLSAGSVPIPNANTCETDIGTDPDPYAKYMCRVAREVRDDPNGLAAQMLAAANADIKSYNDGDKDVTTQHVKWYYPTRQIKTFHPRSRGMIEYREAIRQTINAVMGTNA